MTGQDPLDTMGLARQQRRAPSTTSSAIPANLLAYSESAKNIDAETMTQASKLRSALWRFRDSYPEAPSGTLEIPLLEVDLMRYAQNFEVLDARVGDIGKAFIQADPGALPTQPMTVVDGVIYSYLADLTSQGLDRGQQFVALMSKTDLSSADRARLTQTFFWLSQADPAQVEAFYGAPGVQDAVKRYWDLQCGPGGWLAGLDLGKFQKFEGDALVADEAGGVLVKSLLGFVAISVGSEIFLPVAGVAEATEATEAIETGVHFGEDIVDLGLDATEIQDKADAFNEKAMHQAQSVKSMIEANVVTYVLAANGLPPPRPDELQQILECQTQEELSQLLKGEYLPGIAMQLDAALVAALNGLKQGYDFVVFG